MSSSFLIKNKEPKKLWFIAYGKCCARYKSNVVEIKSIFHVFTKLCSSQKNSLSLKMYSEFFNISFWKESKYFWSPFLSKAQIVCQTRNNWKISLIWLVRFAVCSVKKNHNVLFYWNLIRHCHFHQSSPHLYTHSMYSDNKQKQTMKMTFRNLKIQQILNALKWIYVYLFRRIRFIYLF